MGKAAELAGADPRRCIAYEDAEAGLEAAWKAGCQVVDVRHFEGYPLPPALRRAMEKSALARPWMQQKRKADAEDNLEKCADAGDAEEPQPTSSVVAKAKPKARSAPKPKAKSKAAVTKAKAKVKAKAKAKPKTKAKAKATSKAKATAQAKKGVKGKTQKRK